MVKTLGPYKILKTIAMGGMGEVYLAALERHGGFEKQVALKCVLPKLMADARFLEFFEREARLAAVLTHRNIVPVFDFGRDQGRAWLAMEYVHGVDVKAVYDHVCGPVPTGLALQIATSCARALDYAHRARDSRGRALNIIHRDVSPQNILLSFEGDVKLADFGLAQATARENQEEGTLKGKFAYMSPEQAEARAVDGRSDQFSLAIVLYELLSGTRAFYTEEGAHTILARVAQANLLAPLSEVAPGVSPTIAKAVNRALSKDRRDRFPDAGAFADALQDAANLSGVTIGQPEVGTWLRSMFPERSASLRMRTEQTVESTAVAADPITLNRYGSEHTAVAESPVLSTPSVDIGLENTASAEHPRPDTLDEQTEDAGERTPSIEAPVTEISNSDSPKTSPLSRILIPLTLIAGLAMGGVWLLDTQTSDAPPTEPRASGTSNQTNGVAVAQIARDAFTPREQLKDASAPAQTLADQGPAADAVVRTNELGGRAPEAVIGASPSLKTKVKSASKRAKKTKPRTRKRGRPRTVQATPRAKAPPVPKPIKVDAGLDSIKAAPKTPAIAVIPPSPPPLKGLRIRIEEAQAKIRGAALREGWYQITKRAALATIATGQGPKVKVRAVTRSGVPYVTFGSTPYGVLSINGEDKGPIPGPPTRLATGRIKVEVRAKDGSRTHFILNIAD